MPLEDRLTPGDSPGSAHQGKTRFSAPFLVLCVLAIAVATLRPAGTTLAPGWSLTLASGDEALAEIIQNLLLFIPFGAALALRSPSPEGRGGQGVRVLLAAGLALSFTVEFLQQWLPGRDPSLGDIVMNGLGTLLGGALVWTAPRWLAPPARVAPRLALGAAAVAATAWLATGWLFQPAFPNATYFDRWTPDIPKWPNYEGRIEWATLGPKVLEHGRIDDGYQLLAADAPIRVHFWLGAPPGERAPLFTLTDEHGRDIFVVGIDHADLLIAYRTRATALRLARPDLRARRALAGLAPGDTATVMVTRECINTRCGLGPTIGEAWQLIFFPASFPPWALHLLNAAWIGGGLVGVGLWGRRDRLTGAALLLVVVTLALGPRLVGLRPTSPLEWLGGMAGFVMASLAWRRRNRLSSLRAQPS